MNQLPISRLCPTDNFLGSRPSAGPLYRISHLELKIHPSGRAVCFKSMAIFHSMTILIRIFRNTPILNASDYLRYLYGNGGPTSMKRNAGGSMRLWMRVIVLTACVMALFVLNPLSHAQQDQSDSHRKMVTKVVPIYPNLAQKMGISGSVKIEALVAPNGSVKSADILGGHPVLAQAGLDAARKCKWESASHETKEVVIFNFHPE